MILADIKGSNHDMNKKQTSNTTIASILTSLFLVGFGISFQLNASTIAWRILVDNVSHRELILLSASIIGIGFTLTIVGFALLLIEYVFYRRRIEK